MNGNLLRRGWVTFFITLTLLFLYSSIVHAFTELTDEELSQITGEGFSSFTFENDVAKAYFNIEATTFTEIQSLKMGYYNNGSGLGWDQDWTNVSLGSSTEDLKVSGVYIEAKFSNLSDPATRTLDYIKLGTPHLTGPVTADFNSFSGRVEDGTGTPVVAINGSTSITVDGQRLNLGRQTIYSNNAEFYLKLTRTGSQMGWWTYWNNATITPAP